MTQLYINLYRVYNVAAKENPDLKVPMYEVYSDKYMKRFHSYVIRIPKRYDPHGFIEIIPKEKRWEVIAEPLSQWYNFRHTIYWKYLEPVWFWIKTIGFWGV